jgi:hypothetical protein
VISSPVLRRAIYQLLCYRGDCEGRAMSDCVGISMDSYGFLWNSRELIGTIRNY